MSKELIIAIVSFIIGGSFGLVLGSIINIGKECENYGKDKKNK